MRFPIFEKRLCQVKFLADAVKHAGIPLLRGDVRADALQIAAGDTRLQITPDMLRSAIAKRLAAVESQPRPERPPFLVQLTVDGKRLGLLFDTLAGKMTADQISISGGRFALLLRREDWPD